MMLATMVSLWLSVVVVLLSTSSVSANEEESIKTESEEGGQRMDDRAANESQASTVKSNAFKNDDEIAEYLVSMNRVVMIWTCTNSITTLAPDGKLEMSCSVLGIYSEVRYSHKGEQVAANVGGETIADNHRYFLYVNGHVGDNGHVFAIWRHIKLRVNLPTNEEDSGTYVFEVKHATEERQEMNIYVDLTNAFNAK